MVRPSLNIAVAGTKNTASKYNENFELMLDYLDGEVTAAKTYVDNNVDSKAEIAPAITSLSGTSPVLTDNTVHKILISGNTNFSLPSVIDTTKFHQMLVLVSMPTAYTIDLGTTHYFYDNAPSMSDTGDYTLIYEYDGTNWVVGSMYKG